MGTNYYFALKPERKKRIRSYMHPIDMIFLGTEFKQLHIGKSSCGWTFSFQATEYYKSYKEILEFYETNKKCIQIQDEYGEKITIEEFKELVESKKSEPNNHYLYMQQEYPYDDYGDYLDEDGNSFSKLDFS